MPFGALEWILWQLRIMIRVIDKMDLRKHNPITSSLKSNHIMMHLHYETIEFHYELHPKIKKLLRR